MQEEQTHLAVVGAVITHDKKGQPLKEPYAVTRARDKRIRGTITFSLRLWTARYELSIGDEVRLGGVHRRRIHINDKWGYGWRAESVEPVSPKSESLMRESSKQDQDSPRQESERQEFDKPVTLQSVLGIS